MTRRGFFARAAVCLWTLAGALDAQIPGRNVNMVAGTSIPNGDPYLQRQNEPSIAVSTRNPQHLVGGANDYRSVDIPGIAGGEANGDAWVGIFKTFDGGLTWNSTLLPGYPQDLNCHTAGGQPIVSPLCVMSGYQAAADPVVRAGTNGMFYYSAIAFNRPSGNVGLPQAGGVFLHRLLDNNNSEAQRAGLTAPPAGTPNPADPIQYLGGVTVDQGSSSIFFDKPWIATDIPRGSSTCTVGNGQQIPAANVYVAYAGFLNDAQEAGKDEEIGTIFFKRSTDCGATFPASRIQLSATGTVAQGAVVAVEPATGNVYVAWRQFAYNSTTNAIMIAKSTTAGASFAAPVKVADISPFDQQTTNYSFRTNAYPAMAIDGTGRIYLAWAQVGIGPYQDARIVLTTSVGGGMWSTPVPVDDHSAGGHQIMPAMSFAAGKLTLIYYDFRDDMTRGTYSRLADGTYAVTGRVSLVSVPPDPSAIFTNPMVDPAPSPPGTGGTCRTPGCTPAKSRHTTDVRVAQADAGASPVFHSVKLSQYLFGSRPGTKTIEQLQLNPPNLPMFARGTVPFMGDYIDLAAQPFLSNGGTWSYNTDPDSSVTFHAVWTDNRDVRPPSDGDWTNYSPPTSNSIVRTGYYLPGNSPRPCQLGESGDRNQNIYTAAITQPAFVSTPVTAKRLGGAGAKSFVVNLTNTSDAPIVLRLSIPAQPRGGSVAFFPAGSATNSQLVRLDVTVPPRSTVSRPVFARATNPLLQVTVNVQQVTRVNGTVVAGGLHTTVRLNADPSNPANPDISNPDISNVEVISPDISNPDISNPDISNPDISNPDISNLGIRNPDISNPDISNPNIANIRVVNPDISNPDISNPDISNPDISNPDISNPDISNPDISNAAISDVNWTVTNNGNTTTSFSVKFLLSQPLPAGFKSQLVAYKVYGTPIDNQCSLALQFQNQLLLNIPSPTPASPAQIANPSIGETGGGNSTIVLAPHDVIHVTLRVLNPDKNSNQNLDLLNTVTLVITSHQVNTATLKPGIDASNPQVLPATLPNGRIGQQYSTQLQHVGSTQPVRFSLSDGTLPPGLTLSPNGLISGVPNVAGSFNFSVVASAGPRTSLPQQLSITVTAPPPLAIAIPGTLPGATVQTQYTLTLSGTGGITPYTWSIPQGSTPPPGLSILGSTLRGTPTSIGVFTFKIRLADSAIPASTVDLNASLTVAPAASLSFASLPPAGLLASSTGSFSVQVRATSISNQPYAGMTIRLQLVAPPTVAQSAVNATSSTGISAVTDSAGLATFSNLHIGVPGSGFTWQASSDRSLPIQSPAFDVGVPSTWPAVIALAQPSPSAPGTIFSLIFASLPRLKGAIDVIQGNNVVRLQNISPAAQSTVFDFSMPADYSGPLPAIAAPLTAGPAYLRATYGSAPFYSNWLPVTLAPDISAAIPLIVDIRADLSSAGPRLTTARPGQPIWIGVTGFNNENGKNQIAPHNRITFNVDGTVITLTPTSAIPGTQSARGGYFYFKTTVPDVTGTAQVTFQTRKAITTDDPSNLSAPSAPVTLVIAR